MTTVSAIYARISDDPKGRELGVGRQVSDCVALAERTGWHVGEHYIDNDVSATKGGGLTRGGKRPAYERMMSDAAAGRVQAIVVWDVDRLTRTPRELEDVIEVADRHRLELASVGGEIDLATPQGRMTARIKGVVARHEAEQTSRRVKRHNDDAAAVGQAHGPVRFGWQRVRQLDGTFRDELDPVEAPIVREMADRILAGDSLRTVANALNASGVLTERGNVWRTTTVRRVLLRPGNAGRRLHRGELVDVAGPGRVAPILDPDRYDRLVALLTDPQRRVSPGGARRHLLSGIAYCGRCKAQAFGVTRTANGRTLYQCRACWGVGRDQAAVDQLVTAAVFTELADPGALRLLAAGDDEQAKQAADEIAALQAKLKVAAVKFADDLITEEQFDSITARLRSRLDAAAATHRATMPTAVPLDLAGPDVADRWDACSLEAKRAVIEVVFERITILPTGKGRRTFNPADVHIVPRER